MSIGEIVRQGFHYARTCRSLWIFGFVVGIASGGSGGNGSGGGGGAAGGGSGLAVSAEVVVLFVIGALLVAVAAFVVRFVSEGALVEGVVRARQGGSMTFREGLRAGWAHWGVLLRIAVLYVATTFGSLALLAAPCVLALRSLGPIGAVAFGVPALVVAVPWLITLYLIQAFASRIAVLENRHALDAVGKARLFLHGRLLHGLKLLAAMFVGTFAMMAFGVVTVLPVVFLLVALVPVLSVAPVILLGSLVLLPAVYVLTAVVGTFRSAVWTLGYLTEVDA